MKLKLYKIKNRLSLILSLKLFHERLPIIYVLFNKLFKKIIINKNLNDNELKNFHESGFVKLDINLKDELDLIIKNVRLGERHISDKELTLSIDNKNKKILEEKIKIKLKSKIKKLETYFNSDINFVNLRMWRILHTKKNTELYANRFHQDGYLITFIKIHIHLMDINEADGPMNIISIKNKKKFMKESNYQDRNKYNEIKDKNYVYKNTGKYGDCFLFSSSQCFHKAQIPNNFRDMMQIILVATPKNYDLSKISNLKARETDILKGEVDKIIYYTKPYGIFSIIKIFFDYFFAKNKVQKKYL